MFSNLPSIYKIKLTYIRNTKYTAIFDITCRFRYSHVNISCAHEPWVSWVHVPTDNNQ